MKKTYISPELHVQLMQMEGFIAISIINDKHANSDDALIKGAGEWDDIWGDDEEGFDE